MHLPGGGVDVERGGARLRRPDADLVHLGDHPTGASHERDLLPVLARDHRRVGIEAPVDLLDQALLDLVAVADAVDHDQLGEVGVEVDDRHGLAVVHLEPASPRPPRCRRRAARPARRTRRTSSRRRGGGSTWYVAPQFDADPPAGDAVEDVSVGTSRSSTRSRGWSSSTRSSSCAWTRVRGKPSRTKPSSERTAGGEVLVDHADDDLVGHQLAGVHVVLRPRARSECPAPPRTGTFAGGEVLDAVVLGQAAQPGCPCRRPACRAARGVRRRQLMVRRGSLRSCASSAGCRSASSSRARRPR